MPDEREQKYLSMIEQHPESPLGHFSLGKYYVELGRFREAVASLERCLAEDPEWAAALVALADAHAGLGERAKAIEVLERAQETEQVRGHGSLAQDVEERLADLREG